MKGCVLLLGASVARATEIPESRDIEELSLIDLLDQDQEVATLWPTSAREAPAVVTILTGSELQRAGARDLMDALRLLPAFEYTIDVWNSAGLGVRGNHAMEGKVLVLIDGVEWNETLYASFSLGNRLPVALIDRIEVIRGPGSAIYGGYASLAVIRVTTHATGEPLGGRVEGQTAWTEGLLHERSTLSGTAGIPLGSEGRLGLAATLGTGQRTVGPYTDVFGTTVDLTGAQRLAPGLLSAGLRWQGVDAALVLESYRTTQRDGYDAVQRRPWDSNYHGAYGRISYQAELGQGWSLIPRLSSKWQRPWESMDRPVSSWNYSAIYTSKSTAGLDLRADGAVDLLLGLEGSLDQLYEPHKIYFGGDAQYRSVAGYAQLIAPTPAVDLTAGIRQDWSELYGLGVAPRLALTRAWRQHHLKLMLNRSFRAPGLVHAILGGEEPERSTTLEAELGLRPTQDTYLTLTAFDITIQDPLVYYYELDTSSGAEEEGYRNDERAGTRGGELEARWTLGWVRGVLGWSLYTASGRNRTDTYAVPDRGAPLLGLPTHKGVGRVSAPLSDTLQLGGTTTLLGPRWAITSVDASGESVYERMPTALLVGGLLELDDVGTPGLSIALGVHDLLDTQAPLAQAYDQWHAPLSTVGRSWRVQVRLDR